jgi:type II secretory pathway pseudopilin PulG
VKLRLQIPPRKKRQEQGYVLLAVMLLVTLMLIGLSVELPRISQQIKREKEEELIHRGEEYAKAIKKFRRKMGAMPTSIEQLEDTNHIRFLRKRYKDPFTGEDFKLVHAGEAQIPMPQINNPGLQGSGNPGIQGSTFNSGAPSPTNNGGASAFNSGAPSFGPSTPTGTPNNNTGLSSGTSLFNGGSGLVGSSLGQPGAGGAVGTLQTENVGGPGALQVGGGGIIGVASTSKKTGIKEFNDKSEYDEWYFVYDPRLEQATGQNASATAGIVVGSPLNGANSGNSTGQNPPQPTGTPAPAPPQQQQ